jgi:uncharacterized membrane protein YeaQ/YmgE (transglycosylase-associated protein family)
MALILSIRRRRGNPWSTGAPRLTAPGSGYDPGRTGTAIEEGDTVIGFIVAGLVIGVLARLFKPGKQNLSLLMTLLLGLAGSVIGGVIANLLGTGDIWELNVIGFVVAVIAAVLLIGVFEGLSSKKSHS